MKNTAKLFGIIALITIIWFSFAACGDSSSGDNSSPSNDKSKGATVSSPSLNTKTHDSITINAVAAPGNGQLVEYGKNTSTSAPSTWQVELTFSGLTADTTYYIFARAKENADYNAGTASASLQVKTDAETGGGIILKIFDGVTGHGLPWTSTISELCYTNGNNFDPNTWNKMIITLDKTDSHGCEYCITTIPSGQRICFNTSTGYTRSLGLGGATGNWTIYVDGYYDGEIYLYEGHRDF